MFRLSGVDIGEGGVLGLRCRRGARPMFGDRPCGMIGGGRRRILTREAIVRADEANDPGDHCA
jgi:hypothetical protein